MLWQNYSLLLRKSKTVLDSGFHGMDSGFQAMDSSLQLGLWIPITSGISEPLSWIFPNSKSLDSGFHKQIFQDSGFHEKKICWIPESGFLTWGDIIHKAITYYSFSQTVFVMEKNHVYVWVINVCMRLWENLTNFYLFMFLNFLEIPRIFWKQS